MRGQAGALSQPVRAHEKYERLALPGTRFYVNYECLACLVASWGSPGDLLGLLGACWMMGWFDRRGAVEIT